MKRSLIWYCKLRFVSILILSVGYSLLQYNLIWLEKGLWHCGSQHSTNGIREVAKKWFESYLNNQKQFLTLNGTDSSLKPVSTGVPQGSVLGPLLFLVYINDLHKCVIYSKVYHFADDTNLLQSDNSLKNVAKQMNFDLKNLSQWLKANKLFLNFSKTELIIFYSNSRKIDHSLSNVSWVGNVWLQLAQ